MKMLKNYNRPGGWKKLKSLWDEGLIDDEEYFSFLEDYEVYLEEELNLKDKNMNESIKTTIANIIDSIYPNGYYYNVA